MATKKQITVRTKPGLKVFRRAGLEFGPTPTPLNVDELGEGVLDRLRAETSSLIIEGDDAAPAASKNPGPKATDVAQTMTGPLPDGEAAIKAEHEGKRRR